jgi:hypothetical protein
MKTRLGNLKVVTNTEKKAQESLTYTCVWVKDQSGHKIPLLLTDVELSNAIHRAAKNPEDITSLSFLSKILD